MAIHSGALKLDQGPGRGFIWRLNHTTWHEKGLYLFGAIIVFHWVEHLVQAYQIWVLGRPKPQSLGLAGQQWPWLMKSEWFHYGFAVIMLAGLILLLPGFTGRARLWWTIALVIQAWHFVEHQILWFQYQTGDFWFGGAVPTSVLQQFWPMSRPELHLFYNAIVTVPMIVAIYFHMRPPVTAQGDGTAGETVATAD